MKRCTECGETKPHDHPGCVAMVHGASSRRKFHSGGRSLKKHEIIALGYTEMKMPGKHRYAVGLSASARKVLVQRWASKESNP